MYFNIIRRYFIVLENGRRLMEANVIKLFIILYLTKFTFDWAGWMTRINF